MKAANKPMPALEKFPICTRGRFAFLFFLYNPVFTLFCLWGAWTGYKTHDVSLVIIGIVGALIFLFIEFGTYRTKAAYIQTDGDGIRAYRVFGPPLSLAWKDLTRVRQITGGSGLFLSGKQPKPKLMIPSSCVQFETLREKIFAQWDKNRRSLDLPLAYKGFPGRVLTLDTHGIRVMGFTRTIDLYWKQIKAIEWGYGYFLGRQNQISFVKIATYEGQTVHLRGFGGQLPEIFMTLQRAQRRILNIRTRKVEAPIHHVDSKLSINLWRFALTGVLWVAIPGYFAVKIHSDLSFWAFGIVPGFAMMCLLFWAMKREAAVVRVAAPKEEVPVGVGYLLMLFTFLAAFGLSSFLAAKLGQWEIKRVKARFATEGFGIAMPANSPKIPDRDNGATYLRKANETVSASALTGNGNGMEWQKPFYGKLSQYDLLIQLMDHLQKGPLSKADEGQALRLLAAHQDGIRLLETAQRAKAFDWGMDYTVKPAYLIETPALPGFLNWDRLITLKAYLQAKQGRGKDAVVSLRTCLFLGNAARQSETLLGQMVGAACDKITLSRAPAILANIPAPLLEKDLLPVLGTKGMTDAFMASEEFGLYARWDWKEKFRFFPAEPFELHDLACLYAYKLRKLEALQLSYSKQKAALDQADDAYRRSPWCISEDIITPDFNYQNKVLEAVAEARLAAASIKARLYHQQSHLWPFLVKPLAHLTEEEFVDPFSDGDPLKITSKKIGIQFSSLGPDEWDGNGKPIGRRPLTWVVDQE
jgi:hypothetical protein